MWALTIITIIVVLSLFSKVADLEMLEDGIGKFIEFLVINLSWGLGVNLSSSFLNPFPLISGESVVLGFS